MAVTRISASKISVTNTYEVSKFPKSCQMAGDLELRALLEKIPSQFLMPFEKLPLLFIFKYSFFELLKNIFDARKDETNKIIYRVEFEIDEQAEVAKIIVSNNGNAIPENLVNEQTTKEGYASLLSTNGTFSTKRSLSPIEVTGGRGLGLSTVALFLKEFGGNLFLGNHEDEEFFTGKVELICPTDFLLPEAEVSNKRINMLVENFLRENKLPLPNKPKCVIVAMRSP